MLMGANKQIIIYLYLEWRMCTDQEKRVIMVAARLSSVHANKVGLQQLISICTDIIEGHHQVFVVQPANDSTVSGAFYSWCESFRHNLVYCLLDV